MANTSKAKELIISLDPGFDSMKVIVNGLAFKFPFNILPITYEQTRDLFQVNDDYFVIKDLITNKLFLVGQYAREKIYTDSSKDESFIQYMNKFYSDKRFVDPLFIYVLRTAINLSISKFLEVEQDYDLDDIKNMNITIGIALPHTLRDVYGPTMKEILAGTHKSEMTIGMMDNVHFEYTIQKDNIIVFSQTLSAIICETTDDDGNMDYEKYEKLSQNGPTLILDAGYYTVGIMTVSKGVVNNETAESNTSFAMKNVNEKTAAQLPDVKDYMIEHLCNVNNGKMKTFNVETKKAEVFDVPSIRSQQLSEVCNALIDHIDEKFNYLQAVNHVLITGGTGSSYYDQIKKCYATDRELFNEEDIMLVNSTLFNHEKPAEYGIAVGCYKGLKAVKLALSSPVENESII